MRAAYRDLAPARGWVVIDADGDVERVAERVRDAVAPTPGRMTTVVATEHWARVPGQERAVAQLQRAASRPVHAYLLVGPRGSGVEEAARCFAAALIITDDDERSWDLVLRGVHPDVVEIDPPATQIRIEDAQAVVDEVSRSPIEGERKVVVLFDAERLRLNEAAANKLLKTLEEPPPRAVIVLVTSGADQLLPTIRSRCQRVDFAYLGAGAVAAALVADGIRRRARRSAGAPRRRSHRPRACARWTPRPRARRVRRCGRGDRRHRRRRRAAGRTGAGGDAARCPGIELEQAEEAEQLGVDLEAAGYPERTRRAQLRRLEERHKRADRRARIDAAARGHHRARDGVPGRPRGIARGTPQPRPWRARDRAARRGRARSTRAATRRQAIAEFNPNETLLVERLFLHLPPAAEAPKAFGAAEPRAGTLAAAPE